MAASDVVYAASPTDLDVMADIYRECFPHHGVARLGPRTCRGYLRRHLEHGSYAVAAIGSAGAPRGFAILVTDPERLLSKGWQVRDVGVWWEEVRRIVREPLWPVGALVRAARRAVQNRAFRSAVRQRALTGSAGGAYTWLELLAVRPSGQRKGLGARLVEHCLRLTADLGFARMGLRVAHENTGAIQFYERLGFRRVMDVGTAFVYERECTAAAIEVMG